MIILTLLFTLVSQPAAGAELDLGKLKGEPSRLAWLTDGSQLYFQTAERDSRANVTARHHYLVGLDGRIVKTLEQEPAWAAAYWAKKSGQSAPSMPAYRIAVEQRQETARPTSAPMGGALARGATDASGEHGGQGVSAAEAGAAAFQSQILNVFTLRLKGEVIGEWINQPVVPGSTFGWSREGGRIVFVSKSGGLIVMDPQGRKETIAGTGNASLPAWSNDSRLIAFIERTGKKKAAVRIVEAPR